jgi:hypothetical protein
MTYAYAERFTGTPGHPQIKPDEELAFMGLDWDIRVRTPAIIAVADPASAGVLIRLAPITDIEGVVGVQAVLGALVTKLRAASDAATVASGWTLKTHESRSIMTGFCTASWEACDGSSHGLAWRVAKSVLSKDVTALIEASDVSVLGRYAARTVTWRTHGVPAVRNFTTFKPATVKPLFAAALARIAESRAALIKTF